MTRARLERDFDTASLLLDGGSCNGRRRRPRPRLSSSMRLARQPSGDVRAHSDEAVRQPRHLLQSHCAPLRDQLRDCNVIHHNPTLRRALLAVYRAINNTQHKCQYIRTYTHQLQHQRNRIVVHQRSPLFSLSDERRTESIRRSIRRTRLLVAKALKNAT